MALQQEAGHQTPLDKLVAKLPVSRPLRISLRNTFRRKGRLARTLITLMLGGRHLYERHHCPRLAF